jgi:hypothetical protein
MTTSFVALTDDFIRSHVLNNGELLSRFQFLAAAKTASDALGSCARCQKTAKKAAAEIAFNAAKRAIGTLPAAEREQFKQALHVSRLRVQWVEQVGTTRRRLREEF